MATNFDEPQSRNEAILQNILGADNEILPPFSRIEVLLIELLNMLSAGGLLPDVDSSDNGKVLTVSEGAWSAENLPDGTNTSY